MGLERSDFKGEPQPLPRSAEEVFLNLQAGLGQSSRWNSTTGRGIDYQSRASEERAPEALLSNVTREEIAANIAASEARTDAKFERVMGRLDLIEKSTSGLRATMIGTGIAIAAVLISVMAYGGQMFGIGLDSQSIAEKAATGVESRTSTRLDNLDAQIRALTEAIQASQGMAVVPRETPPG